VNEDKWILDKTTYCETCRQRTEKQKLLEQVEIEMDNRFGEKAKNYSVSKLLSLVYEAIELDNQKGQTSAKSQRILTVYLSEKYKYERYKEANKPK
jgi:hypothetical protein